MGMVRAGQTGVDFSYTKPPPHRVKELGYTVVVGYESEAPSSPNKNLTNPHDYIAEGLQVCYVWEMSATSTSGGYSAGQRHAAAFTDKLLRHGLPFDNHPIFANDTNTTAANLAVHVAYMTGAHAEMTVNGPWSDIGEYADDDLLEATVGLWGLGWLPNAWSWSGHSRAEADARAAALGVHVLQRTGLHIDNQFPVDPNEVINAFQAWGWDAPPIGDDDMATAFLEVDELPGQYMWTPGSDPIAFTNPEDRDAMLKALGIDPATGGRISIEMYERLFVPAPPPVLIEVDVDALACAIAAAMPPIKGTFESTP